MDYSSDIVRNGRVPLHSSEKTLPRAERKYRISKTSRKAATAYAPKSKDGELFKLIREYMSKKDKQRVDDCRNRLSRCKQISLDGLLKRVQIAKSLDHLQKFPGILHGLELGNVHKHLSLHCDSNIIHFFESHIENIWSDITEKDPSIQQHVDLITVQRLQFRAPAASSSDRRSITQMFDCGDVFEGILDAEVRDRVKKNVLKVKVVIPSVQSFHENMKFFSLGIKIIRKNIADPSPRGNWLPEFMNCWRLPAVPYVETAHGCLKPLATPQLTAHLAFTQIFLAALRNFPCLCSERPRQDKREESMPAYTLASMVHYLSELAFELGFNNETITKNMTQDIEDHSSIDFRPEPGVLADWRGGKPFTKTFFALRSQAFLPKLSQPIVEESEPSPLFIMKDFMKAFFGNFESVVLDKNQSSITLVGVAASKQTEDDIARPEILRSQKKGVGGSMRRTYSHRVEKKLRARRRIEVDANIWHSLARSSDSLPTHSQSWSESSTDVSTDEQNFAGRETLARKFHRSPIPSPFQSPAGLYDHSSGRQGRVLEIRDSSSDSVAGSLNQDTSNTTLGHYTPHQNPTSSSITSLSTFDQRRLGQTIASESSTTSVPNLASLWSQSSRPATARIGKSEGECTMPNRSARSPLKQGCIERRDDGQLVACIPPIRAMRTARKPRQGYSPFTVPLMPGSPVERVSLERRPITRRPGFRLGPADQTRAAQLVPPSPLRPEANSSRHSGAFFERQEASRGGGRESFASATRRHAVYIPFDAEHRAWLESEKMPFGRPAQKSRYSKAQ